MKNSQIKVTYQELCRRQALPLEEKKRWVIERYLDYVEVFHKVGVYKAFSAGKDSQVMKHIIDQLHAGNMSDLLRHEYRVLYKHFVEGKPSPPDVFCDTGLEFPEIRKHCKTFPGVVWLKPAMNWMDVVQNVGYLIGSKLTSRKIHDIRNPTGNNEATRHLYLTGQRSDGSQSNSAKLPKFWQGLINAPFNVSHKCCDIFKKDPFKLYEKKTGRMPITATTAKESDMRRFSYLKTGCNSFEGHVISRPMSIWTTEDMWAYAEQAGIRFCEIYYEREVEYTEDDGKVIKVVVPGEEQTGCMFCMVGPPTVIKDRWSRMKITHNKAFKFMMDGPLDIRRKVLGFMGIKIK